MISYLTSIEIAVAMRNDKLSYMNRKTLPYAMISNLTSIEIDKAICNNKLSYTIRQTCC